MKRLSRILKSARVANGAAFAVALGLLFSPAAKAEEAPHGNQGFKANTLQTIDLGAEISGMEGRQLRLRVLTIEPGGHIGIHSHKDRPAVVYFLKGTDTVVLGDGKTKTLKPGDSGTADHNTTHWHQNSGNEPVVFIAVDILHKKK